MENKNQQMLEQLQKMNEQLLANLFNQSLQRRNNRKIAENLKKSQKQLWEALSQQLSNNQ
jgi:hypothetical protein